MSTQKWTASAATVSHPTVLLHLWQTEKNSMHCSITWQYFKLCTPQCSHYGLSPFPFLYQLHRLYCTWYFIPDSFWLNLVLLSHLRYNLRGFIYSWIFGYLLPQTPAFPNSLRQRRGSYTFLSYFPISATRTLILWGTLCLRTIKSLLASISREPKKSE